MVRRVSAKRASDIVDALTVNEISVEIPDDLTAGYVMSFEDFIRMHLALASDGTIVRRDGSGQDHVVEENSLNISNMSTYMHATSLLAAQPTIGAVPSSNQTICGNAHHRLAVLPMTTDALGDVGPTPVVTAPAGYYPVMRLLYVYADGTDGAWDLAITVSAGALVGIPAMTGLATTVNVIGPDWTPGGLLFYDTTDATTISFTISNGGNTITYYFVYEYWYET